MINTQIKHPCYNENCIKEAKMIHLPVAFKCNIKCEFCNKQVSNCKSSQPGISSIMIKPFEVLEYIQNKGGDFSVVGIAGPGDPLFNEETFQTLKILKGQTNYPTCICTNGLLLEDKLLELLELDLDFLSVTVNAMDYKVAEQIYSRVFYNDKQYIGEEAAKLLLSKQQSGIALASEQKNFKMKINTVYIPGINDGEIIKIAKMCNERQIDIMNIIPVIPCGKFINNKVDREHLAKLREEAEKYVPQKMKCGMCRADACGYIKER